MMKRLEEKVFKLDIICMFSCDTWLIKINQFCYNQLATLLQIWT